MRKVFLLGCGPLPFERSRLHSGPGIRTWQLARPLLESGCTLRLVTVCPPGESPECPDLPAGLDLVRLSAEEAIQIPPLLDLVRGFEPDVLIGATAYPSFLLARLPVDPPLWADLFGDPMAEAQARAAGSDDDWAIVNNRYMLAPILERADAFSVVSDRHKDALLGQLGLVGRLNQHTADFDLVRVIPCAWNEELAPPVPAGASRSDHDGGDRPAVIALSSGGFNTWCDVETLHTALERAMVEEPRLRFVATGGPIPGFDDFTFERFRARIAASPQRDRFELTGWVERDELDRRERTADFGIVAERPLPERRLGSANRCLQWMGRGLPFVCARISELSEQLERDGLALTYPPGDARALAAAIVRLAREGELRRELAARAARAAGERFSFEATTRPLRDWLCDPRVAPDRGRFQPWPDKGREHQLEAEARDLGARLHAIERSRTWRLWMLSIAVRRFPHRVATTTRQTLGRGLRAARDAVYGSAVRLGEGLKAGWVVGVLSLFTAGRLLRAGRRSLVPIGLRPKTPIAREPDLRGRRPRVLVVCPYPLIPAYQGGSVRIVRLLEQLSASCELYVFTFDHASDDPAQRRTLERWCRRVVVHRREEPSPAGPHDLDPPSVKRFASQAVREHLADLVRQEQIDVVQLEFTELGQYADVFGDAKVVLSELDLGFVTSFRRRAAGFHHRFEIDRQLWSSRIDWMRLLRYELRMCERVDQVQVMSERDGEILARFLADGWRRIRVIPNGVEPPAEPPPPSAHRNGKVLFVGFFGHSPNLDALSHLVEAIWPLVRARRPDAGLTVVGANPPASVRALDGRDGIEVVGTVPEPRPYYRSHRLLAAPLRAGSGTRLKILEAFAEGLPVVTTALGAEGLAARSGEHLLLASTPAEHAAAIVELLGDDGLFERLAAAARELVAAHYSWRGIAARARAAYDELLADGAETAAPSPEPASAPSHTPGALAPSAPVEISVILPTLDGGERLEQALGAIAAQATTRRFEVICVDSGSRETELEVFQRFGVRLVRIPNSEFNHGLTRDLGARHARGEVLVFLNQDAVPCDRYWLDAIADPLLRPSPYAAVQGGIREFPQQGARFFWDSCGDRFYFTRETARWLAEYRGLGFSTINAAIRREVWERIPFGWAPIMEDKKWQRQARRAGLEIAYCPWATVFHSHTYGGRTLLKRCAAEGFGWRTLGIAYSLRDLAADLRAWGVLREGLRGLRRREIRSAAELFFPLLRPLGLYWGNRWLRSLPR